MFYCASVRNLDGLRAQGVGTSGEITGTVTDSSGGVLPKATVNVVDTQTGLKRTATTNGTGQFRVAGLSPATYDISAEMPGFATEIRRGVTVAIGQTVVSDFKLKPSKVATVIEVTDQPPVVETERGSQADRSRNSTSPTCRLTGAITLRLRCSRPGSPIPPGWRATRISESSKHRKAGCRSTAAMAGETA